MVKIKSVIALCVCVLLVVCAENAKATKGIRDTVTGKCGDNLGWSLDRSTNVLTISGNGLMECSSNSMDAPWWPYADEIHEVVFEGSVTSISGYAFYDCGYITSISLPSTIAQIGDHAFDSCRRLQSITIPWSVTAISTSGVFRSCTSLTAIHVEEGNYAYGDIDGVLFYKTREAIIACPPKKQGRFVIPSSVRNIIDDAFLDCELTEVILSEGVESISQNAFHKCSNLKNVTIPASVISIGDAPFLSCSSLEWIEVDESNQKYESVNGVLIGKNVKNIIQYPNGRKGTYVVPSDVQIISPRAFQDSIGLTAITIPAVTTFRSQAFHQCTNLELVSYLRSTSPSCDEDVFTGCSDSVAVCVPADFGPYSELCDLTDKICKSDSCADLQDIENHCFKAVCMFDGLHAEKRENASEWEGNSDHCYEYQCHNQTGKQFSKRDNATEWENKTNYCYVYQCINKTGELIAWRRDNATEWENKTNYCYVYQCINKTGELISWKRDNAIEWEKHNNHCFEYQCINETGQLLSWKRNNATEWEKKTNGCVEYQCDNETGLVSTGKCVNSGRNVCVDNQCATDEKQPDKTVAVNITIDVSDEDEVNTTKITQIVSDLTGLKPEDFGIGVEMDENGRIKNVIVYLGDDDSATLLITSIDGIKKGDGCQYGLLCRSKTAMIMQQFIEESQNLNWNVMVYLVSVFIIAMTFM